MQRRYATLKPLAAVLILSFPMPGCAGFVDRIAPVEKVELAAIDPRLKAPCAVPQAIPEGDQPVSVLAPLWRKDRTALSVCGARHQGLVEAIETIGEVQGRGSP